MKTTSQHSRVIYQTKAKGVLYTYWYSFIILVLVYNDLSKLSALFPTFRFFSASSLLSQRPPPPPPPAQVWWLVLGPDYLLGRELFLTALLTTTPNPPKNVRQRGRSLASRQHPREQLRNRNKNTMIRRMIPTTMILLLLRNASVDVGRLRSRHIFVAIVVVEMGSKRQGQHQSMITMMPKQQLQVDCIQQPMTGVKSGSKHLVTAMQDIEPMPLTS